MAKSYDNRPYDVNEEYTLRCSGIPTAIMMSGRANFDSVEDASVFFARELDAIKTRSYDAQYPRHTALRLFPISHEVDSAAETITYYTYDKVGLAKVISNYATDLPRADVNGKPTTAQVRALGSSYGYSAQEMRASRFTGKSLDVRKAESAHFQIDVLTNQIAWRGDDESGLMGVLSAGQNVPVYTLPEGASGVTEWKNKTADEILEDINGMVAYMCEITNDVERADTLVLPANVFMDISQRRVPNTQAITIRKFLLDNAVYIKDIVSAAELQWNNVENNPYASTDAEEGKGVAFLFTNSKDKLSLEIPMPYYQHPLQVRNLETIIPCEQRVAGVIMYYPYSALIAVGV